MGVVIAVVQDEEGNQVGECVDLPIELLPNLHDSKFACLRFIDPYGDTLFNRLQLPAVLEDVRLLKMTERTNEQNELIYRIEALVGVCEKKPHLYLKFIGD